VIKKIQLELIIFALLLICVILTYKVDTSVYAFFANYNYGSESDYLKKFFVGITDVGDSFWYFIILILVFLLSYLSKITGLLTLNRYSYLQKLSFFGFTYLFIVGVITQIIKHIVGRPRPNHTLLDGSFEFNFFTTDSAFHSFPSGHSSTIIAVVIISSLIFPSIKYFFYLCGFLIAISRVVVGAHFFTDVVAGTLIAIIAYKVFDFVVKNNYPKIYWNNLRAKNVSIFTKTIIVFLILAIFTTVGPEIDIYVSSLFYFGDKQFLIQSYYFVSIFFRKILLPILLLYIFVLPIIGKFLPLKKIYFYYKFSLSQIFFVWVCGTLTLLVIVNIILKNMWGRVRPNEILPFGGSESFSPWYKISDSCISNCSFVSGDSSVGFLLIIFYFLTNKNIYLYLGLTFGFLLGFIRIIAGGHFFSDIIFSQIIVAVSVLIFFTLYKKIYDK